MTNEQFAAAYLAMQGWTEPVVTDEDLALEYPVCVYDFACGRRVTAVCEQIPLQEVPAGEPLERVLEALFEMEALSMRVDRVLGLYAAERVQAAERLPGVRAAALHELLEALAPDERMRGQVTMQDDLTACVMQDGRMLAAAGAVCQGGFADLAVCVHPCARGRGLGRRAVLALADAAQRAGYVPLYRVEESNAPSLRLARSLGLATGFVMRGALLTFPNESP